MTFEAKQKAAAIERMENMAGSWMAPAILKPAASFVASGLIARPGQCYVRQCHEPIVRDELSGAPEIFRHKRFGPVHSCACHDPLKA